jgi:hypothetical protein
MQRAKREQRMVKFHNLRVSGLQIAFSVLTLRAMKFRVFLLPLVALVFMAAANKRYEVSIRIHAETTRQDTSSFSIPVVVEHPHRELFIDKIPDISERDIVAMYPFPADDGTFGCTFKLDEHGKINLETVSTEKRGYSLVAVVDGLPVDQMLVDARVKDGILTIRRGFKPEQLVKMKKFYRVLGEKKKK